MSSTTLARAPTWDAVIPVNPTPLPTNDVAVITPVTLKLPVPVISLPLRSKSPPSCGVVSSTTLARAPTWDAVIPVNPVPLPWNDVAVTELIPEILVALSPTIFPFAVTLPETVSAVRVPTEVTEELTTFDPNVVALRTCVWLMWYPFPHATF